MVITVNLEDLTPVPEENKLVAEASTLRCEPGVWPDAIVVFGFGNAHYDRHHDVRAGGELSAVVYRSRCGHWDLVLLND